MQTTTAPTTISLSDPKLFRQACYIDGAWVEPRPGAVIEVDNPATGETIGVVPKLGAAETRKAIEAAARAFPDWSSGRRRSAQSCCAGGSIS